jgi:hypothetical protein
MINYLIIKLSDLLKLKHINHLNKYSVQFSMTNKKHYIFQPKNYFLEVFKHFWNENKLSQT